MDFNLLGFPGTYEYSESPDGRVRTQVWDHTFINEKLVPRGQIWFARIQIRFDDRCGNGHSAFSITGEVKRQSLGAVVGACHEDLAEAFPELAHLFKWHLCSTDGPMHYVANTLYHASDRDHNGLRHGETRQLRNGRTNLPVWRLETEDGDTLHSIDVMRDSEQPPAIIPVLRWVPVMKVGEGKKPDFDAARATAIWPDATDEQLSLPREELRTILINRLDPLMEEFRAMIQSIGFVYR